MNYVALKCVNNTKLR